MFSLEKIPGFTTLLDTIQDKEKATELCKNNGMRLISYFNKKTNLQQYILKYDKNLITQENTESLGLARSIILNEKKEILSFAPPKSFNNYTDLLEKKFETDTPCLSIEDFAEGTMIHLYYNKINDENGYWETSTRSNIGANNYFYNNGDKKEDNKTFRQMFLEICKLANFDYEKLPKEYCYNFVLKHPVNRIVQPVVHPCLILTNVYQIKNYHVFKIANEMILNYVNVSNHFNIIHTYEKITIKQSDDTFKEKIDHYINTYCSENTNCLLQGLVFHVSVNSNIIRYKVRNPNYESVKKLKGNNPRLQFHYLSLRKENKVRDYIQFYGKAKEFQQYRNQMHKVTSDLYTNYISCYIKKERPLIEFSEQFRTHMFNIHHNIYLKNLKSENKKINFEIIKNYVNDLEIIHQLYFINYQLRQKNIEEKKVETIFNDVEQQAV